MYAVGIDVSKSKSNVAILSLDGEVIKNEYVIAHDEIGFSKLLESIKDFPKNDVRFIMEATGIYLYFPS